MKRSLQTLNPFCHYTPLVLCNHRLIPISWPIFTHHKHIQKSICFIASPSPSQPRPNLFSDSNIFPWHLLAVSWKSKSSSAPINLRYHLYFKIITSQPFYSNWEFKAIAEKRHFSINLLNLVDSTILSCIFSQ